MSIKDFPDNIEVVLGDAWNGINGLSPDTIIVLTKVTGQDTWTEDGTLTPSITNRIQFKPYYNFGYCYLSLSAFNGTSFTLLVNGTYGPFISVVDPYYNSYYDFKEVFDYISPPNYGNTLFLTTTNVIYNPDIFKSLSAYVPSPAITFVSDKNPIAPGESAELSWTVDETLPLIGDVLLKYDTTTEIVSAVDTKIVSPSSTTTYTIEAENSTGVNSKDLILTVAIPPGPTITFDSDKYLINEGDSAELSWTIVEDPAYPIVGDILLKYGTTTEIISASGNKTITPSDTTEYTIEAENAYTLSSESLTVGVVGNKFTTNIVSELISASGGAGLGNSIALDGSGVPHCSFYSGDINGCDLWYVRGNGSGGYLPPQNLDSSGVYYYPKAGRFSSILIGSGGTIHITYTYQDQDPNVQDIRYIYSTDGGVSFSSPVTVVSNIQWDCSIDTALDSDSVIHVGYRGNDNDYHSMYGGSGGWTYYGAVGGGNVGANYSPYDRPALLCDSTVVPTGHRLHYFWQHHTAGDLFHSRMDGAGGWIHVLVIGGPSGTPMGVFPGVVQDSTGNLHLVSIEHDYNPSSPTDYSFNIRYFKSDLAFNWSAPVIVASGIHGSPSEPNYLTVDIGLDNDIPFITVSNIIDNVLIYKWDGVGGFLTPDSLKDNSKGRSISTVINNSRFWVPVENISNAGWVSTGATANDTAPMIVLNNEIYAIGYWSLLKYDNIDSWITIIPTGLSSFMDAVVLNNKIYAVTSPATVFEVYSWSIGDPSWTFVAKGLISSVKAQRITVHNGQLYVSTNNSDFVNLVPRVYVWDGVSTTMTQVAQGYIADQFIVPIISFNNKLYTADSGLSRLTEVTGGNFVVVVDGGVAPANDGIRALIVFQGKLFAGSISGALYSWDGLPASGWVLEAPPIISLNPYDGIEQLIINDNKLYARAGRFFSHQCGLLLWNETDGWILPFNVHPYNGLKIVSYNNKVYGVDERADHPLMYADFDTSNETFEIIEGDIVEFVPVSRDVVSVSKDPIDDHFLWFVTSSVLKKVDDKTESETDFTQFKNNASREVTTILVDNLKQVWVGYATSSVPSLLKLESDETTVKEFLTGNTVLDILRIEDDIYTNRQDSSGEKGLYKIHVTSDEDVTFIPIDFDSGSETVSLTNEDNDILWCANRFEGIIRVNTSGHILDKYTVENSPLTSNLFTSIDIDTNGRIWIGTEDEGLFILERPDTWENIKYDPEINFLSNKITSIEPDKSGRMWIGTEDAGVFKYDPTNIIPFTQYNKDNSILESDLINDAET